MINTHTNIAIITTLLTLLASTAQAKVLIYTDRTEWESAVISVGLVHFHWDDFSAPDDLPFHTGRNHVSHFLTVNIPGDPAGNRISTTLPSPFSPNGSSYYQGWVDNNATEIINLEFEELDFAIIGFGADWTHLATRPEGLTMEIQGTYIPFNTYLPSGSGFLGIITDQPSQNDHGIQLTANLTGQALFGVDDVITANTHFSNKVVLPIPASAWFFVSGLIGLIAFSRGNRSHKERGNGLK